MTLTDTHCHIQEASYLDSEGAYERALAVGVGRMIVVGTDEVTSREAVEFAAAHANAWAAVGLHPHDAVRGLEAIDDIRAIVAASAASLRKSDRRTEKNSAPTAGSRVTFSREAADAAGAHRISSIVAIGEIGLDYFYDNSPREQQIDMLHAQIELALEHNLPVIFHVREASSLEGRTSVWDDFWPIFDQYKGLRGVLHSFTDNLSNMEAALSRGLLIGVNGIATFARDRQEVYRAIPYEKILLETDAPYLTPVPHRGKVNEPALLQHVAEHIANLQSINLQELSRATEASATHLFHLK
ncbi:MAG: TatD family hydrolase [Candidatus Saccharimonadales bacterium]